MKQNTLLAQFKQNRSAQMMKKSKNSRINYPKEKAGSDEYTIQAM